MPEKPTPLADKAIQHALKHPGKRFDLEKAKEQVQTEKLFKGMIGESDFPYNNTYTGPPMTREQIIESFEALMHRTLERPLPIEPERHIVSPKIADDMEDLEIKDFELYILYKSKVINLRKAQSKERLYDVS